MARAGRPLRLRLFALILAVGLAWGPARPAGAGDPNESWGSLGASHWTDGRVLDLTLWRGDLVACGQFGKAGGKAVANLARWDGQEWHQLGGGVGWAFPGSRIETMVEFEGDLVVGGQFLGAGNDPDILHLARWDGTAWTDLEAGLDPGGNVTALAVFQNSLIVAGDFDRIGSRSVSQIAQYRDGWQPMGQGFNQEPFSLLAHDGTLIAGGPFSSADGLPRETVARWVNGRWEAMGDGLQARGDLPASVLAFAVYRGEVYAAGHFFRSGSTSTVGVARWDGLRWVGLTGGGIAAIGDDFWAMSLFEYNDELYIGGNIDLAGGVPVNDVARWDGNGWRDLGAGVSDFVRDMELYDDMLFIAGDFTAAGGMVTHFIGTWNNGPLSIGGGQPALPGPVAAPTLALLPSHPNPFNPATTLRFSLPRLGRVSLRIVDLRGALVRTLVREVYPAGLHQVRWDGRDDAGRPVASGVYLVHLDATSQRRTGKLTLVR